MKKILNCVFLVLFFLGINTQCKMSDTDTQGNLEDGFVNPPNEAKPRVWWHWMNGNITKDGIQKDLEWMNRVGIGGFQNFDAAFMTPQIVEKRLVYMAPEWKDAFQFTTQLADSLELEMAIAGSPGWSESGGPWVKPGQAMKKLVWSEMPIEGGKYFSGTLPHPPTATGPFQNMVLNENFMPGEEREAEKEAGFYADAAVVAYRIPETNISLTELQPKITSSGGNFNLKMLTDGDLVKTAYLPPVEVGQRAWIQYEFEKPETIFSLTIVGGVNSGRFGTSGNPENIILESSQDGKTFEKVTGIYNNRIGQVTETFDPVTAKYFRFAFKTLPAGRNGMAAIMGMGGGPAEPKGTDVAELVLHTAPKINRFEEKAAFTVNMDLASLMTKPVDNSTVISKDDIVDLTSKMNADGTIEWDAPAGNWNIMRFGYTLTGHKNSPASPEATGLEVDKLSAEHVTSYFTQYLDMYKDATGGLMGENGLQYIITDSWEAGTQNWTDNMPADFLSKRGYDIIPWLPVVAGHIIQSSEASERFLWDLRKTIADLTTENHYDLLTDILKERGMGRYSESHEDMRAFIGDGMEVKRSADVPMSATWTPTGNETEVQTRFKADVRESASVSHIYGQNLVAAESMTAIGTAWAWSPETLKPTADMELACGLNRFVIHTSVHQPVDDKIPGLGLGPFGQWFTRHETWAEQAKPWMDYLARSCYMLQQGKFVADIVYYYGEDNNITALFGAKMPDIPEGYNYDFVNADALVNVLVVNNNLITTPSGMSYKILALDKNTKRMSLPVLRKLAQLAEDGAIIVGQRPQFKASLQGDLDEFNQLVDEIWKSGKENIHENESIQQVLASLNLNPDFSYTSENNAEILNVHRKLGDIDIYWVNSRSDQAESVLATFRVDGKKPEIWQPETGEKSEVSYQMKNGETTVSLNLKPNDAVFVVFAQSTNKTKLELPVVQEKELLTVEGPWDISFQPERGAPAKATFDQLVSYTENEDEGIKYFSGTATYTNTFQISEADLANEDLCLDLGDVQNLAEVTLNGKKLGVIWKKPFRLDIKDAVQAGENELEIKVVNLWVNRLIGDAQPDVSEKITYTTMPFYQANSQLLPSGLLGPVQLIGTL
ncbi:glycosyl hydrolase [Draconibacterium sp. IB214405]|uniref:glycosyl hydrolase n=1 Tax=Draconibacterium sp. IB214405 TaxID=3097352 RepID=UPI002A0C0868|nr:glycosyl hydrolase [Draconibacterium sp. IB214405]MDX8337774.1 glycosyl hydrolase [Draconibacterium sp. IB214405]